MVVLRVGEREGGGRLVRDRERRNEEKRDRDLEHLFPGLEIKKKRM